MSIKRGQIAQNIYSAQSCLKSPDCQTGQELKEAFCEIALPVEQSPILAPTGACENTIVSAGGCRFIEGTAGSYHCGCTDARQCHKSYSSQVLTLTPRCFSYHDRHVPVLSNMDKGKVTV